MTKEKVLAHQDKIKVFFDSKFEEIGADAWLGYCMGINVLIAIPSSWGEKDEDNHICIVDPCVSPPQPPHYLRETYFLFIPLDLAERALMLGGIP